MEGAAAKGGNPLRCCASIRDSVEDETVTPWRRRGSSFVGECFGFWSLFFLAFAPQRLSLMGPNRALLGAF